MHNITQPNRFGAAMYDYNVWQSTKIVKNKPVFENAGVDVTFYLEDGTTKQGHTAWNIVKAEYDNSSAWPTMVATYLAAHYDVHTEN